MRAPSPIRRVAPSKLPSKKILPIIAACVVVVGTIAIIVFYNPGTNPVPQSSTLAVVNAASASGLAQSVYEKIQTELTELATSTASGADSTTSTVNTRSGNTPNTPPPTATAVLSQEFINEYLSAKQSGQTLSPSDAQSLIPNLIANGDVTNYIPQAAVYTPQDLTISQDNSTAAFRTYGNAVGAVFARNQVSSSLNELDILQSAVNSGNPQDLANLAIITASYSGIVNGLLKIPVPSQAASLHLATVNDFSQALNSVEGMQKLFTDPVVTVSAVENYETIAPTVYNDITAFNPLFAKHDVVFASNEAGSMLTAK